MIGRTALLTAVLTGCAGDTVVKTYNTPPSVTISSPTDGTTEDEGVSIAFQALLDDDFDKPQDLVVSWYSTLDDELPGALPADADGVAVYETSNLSAGNHEITVQVIDSDGESARDSIGVSINELPDAPEITMVHPTGGESGSEGSSFEFVAKVSDQQDSPEALVVTFESDIDGVFCTPTPDALGVASCDAELSGTSDMGSDHTVTMTVRDTAGYEASVSATFAVLSNNDKDIDGDGYTTSQGDCNDGDGSVHPNATEYCNERDDDCDSEIDDGTTCHDDDGDGYSELDDDCDDTDATVYPGADESYNAVDDDCDGKTDEGTEGYDDDGDGYTEVGGDCDDSTAVTHYGASEVADYADNDCDGIVDEGTSYYDDDGDGYTEAAGDCNDASSAYSPAATETCDSYDNDCDGTADEAGATSCTTFYYDYDGDGYGTTTSACLCTTSGYYTSPYSTDCYDGNKNANPTATSYSTTNRGDGSYDYNCDGSSSYYYTATYSCSAEWYCFSCDSYTEGYGSVPGCGSSGTWYTGCSASWCDCDHTGSTSVTQACR